MTLVRRIALAFAAVVVCFGGISEARAEHKIAVVDMRVLLSETAAAKSIQEQTKAKRDALQAEFQTYEKQLSEEEKALMELKKADNQDEFNKKRQAFEKKFLETRNLFQKKKGSLEEAIVEARGKLTGEIFKIVAAISEEKGYDIVLSRQNLVIVDKSLEITAEVKTRLEKALTKVDMVVKE